MIQQLLIEPVLTCALNANCICPPNQSSLDACRKVPAKTIGVCNRNDKSSLSLIVSRIFREKYFYAAVDLTWCMETRRGHSPKYFEELAVNEKQEADKKER